MPSTLSIRRPGSRTPSEIAILGGWWFGPLSFTDGLLDDPWETATRDKLMEARWRDAGSVAPAGTERLRYTLGFRPELARVWTIGNPAFPGFRLEWIKRTPLDEFVSEWKPWQAAGYKIVLHTFADPRAFDLLFPVGWPALGLPTPYVSVTRDKTLMIQAAMVDLRNPDYRTWLMTHLLASMRWSGADAVYLSIKHSWLASPQIARLTPQGLRRNDTGEFEFPSAKAQFDLHGVDGEQGVITDTSYQPGEFEEGYKLLTQDLDAHGIRIVTQVISHEPDLYAAFAPESASWLGQIQVLA